jgi:hypothetical protein
MNMGQRPGPECLEPGIEPGGTIVHVYALPTNRLVSVSSFVTDADAVMKAEEDTSSPLAELQPGENAHAIVFFDGDSGLFVEGYALVWRPE